MQPHVAIVIVVTSSKHSCDIGLLVGPKVIVATLKNESKICKIYIQGRFLKMIHLLY